MEDVVGDFVLVVPISKNFQTIPFASLMKLFSRATVGIICPVGTVIELAALDGFSGIKEENIKPKVDRLVFPGGHGFIFLVLIVHGSC